MAESTPSDFIDFNKFRDVTAESERRILQRQQGNVDSLSGEADRLLRVSARDTDRQQQDETRGDGRAHSTLSQVGSYGDYLKAKSRAESARAAMLVRGSGAYGDVRASLDQTEGYSKDAAARIQTVKDKEGMYGAQADAGVSHYNRLRDETRSREAAAAAAAKQRADTDAENKAKFQQSIRAKMMQGWSEQDKRHAQNGGWGVLNPFRDGSNGFGGEFNPFGWQRGKYTDPYTGREYGETNGDQRDIMGKDAYLGLEDNQRLAQMARSEGMNDEADRYQSTATYDIGGKRTSGGY